MKKWIVFCVAILMPQIPWAADIQATLQWSHRVELSTPVSGVIQAVNVEVGEKVKSGQLLLSLDTTSYQARVDANRSEITRLIAEADEAKRDLDRIQELYDRTVTSTADLDQAKLRLVNGQSRLSEARARLRQNQKALDDASIRAPFDAIVIIRQAEPGQSVAATLQTQMLLTLAKSGEMIARMHLTAPQIDKLKTGQTVTVRVSGISYPGQIKMLGLEPSTVKDESVYPVDVVFPSKETLRAGTQALVILP
jgi:RND family efflux transporter MFP subunit